MNQFLFKTDFLSNEVVAVLASLYLLITVLTIVFYSVKIVKGSSKLINELIDRTRSWWIMLLLFTFVVFINREVAVCGIALLSLVAFRELSSNLNLRQSDRRTLLWCYIAIPFQFMAA